MLQTAIREMQSLAPWMLFPVLVEAIQSYNFCQNLRKQYIAQATDIASVLPSFTNL